MVRSIWRISVKQLLHKTSRGQKLMEKLPISAALSHEGARPARNFRC